MTYLQVKDDHCHNSEKNKQKNHLIFTITFGWIWMTFIRNFFQCIPAYAVSMNYFQSVK